MKKLVLALITAALVCSCGIYSFSGTSIQPDVATVSIDLFEYKALKVNPTLSNDLTEGLKTKFRQMTRLEQVEENADLEIFGEVTGYSISASSITADEVAASNKLTITVKASFTNRKYPEDDFTDKVFSGYAEYDSNQTFESVEATLTAEIVEKIVDDIFNASVAQW